MHVRGIYIFFSAQVVMGAVMFPLVSYALTFDNLYKIHDESRDQREVRREQFKQDVLEKRKEVLSKWANRKQGFEEKLSKERDRVKSGFELRRRQSKEDKDSLATAETQEQRAAAQEKLFSLIKKNTQNIVDLFLPLKNLFSNGER